MKQKFSELEKLLRQAAQTRQDARASIAKLNAQRKNYSAEYVKDFLDPSIAKVKATLKAYHQDGFEKAARLLQDLSEATIAKHSKLNLENPAWANALKLVELSGPGLDPETVRKINASFAGDQAALRALRDVYKARGMIYDGGLDQQIYDPESAFERLRDYIYNAFIVQGSLNTLSTAISHVAALEGIEFPKMVDEPGAEEVMRTAAGLAAKAR